ncbi:MAG: hypothetical protein NC124_20845 [Clostridium sp.]|nr:hypothetical protein [Clostridium sp.]
MEKVEYAECYIAFLDILGFKKFIADNSCDEIAKVFARFSNRKPLKAAYLGNKIIISENTANELKIKVMSDSICFYIDVNLPNALLCIIMSCMNFQYDLYKNNIPIFLRGAIVRGHLYANKDIIYGPGLTQAYLLEENNASYPRIILTGETLQFVVDNNENSDVDYRSILKSILIRDDDAFYAVNCIKMLFDGDQATYENVENQIKYMLDTTVDGSIRDKYLYLQRKLRQGAYLKETRKE